MNLDPNNLEPRDVMLLNALDRISLNLGCLTTAVSRLEPKEPENDWADSDYVEIDADPRVIEEAGRTDWLTTTLADGDMCGSVTTWHDDGSTGFYISSDGDIAVKNPEELDELAERLSDVYAPALHEIASIWAQRRIDGKIPAKESES